MAQEQKKGSNKQQLRHLVLGIVLHARMIWFYYILIRILSLGVVRRATATERSSSVWSRQLQATEVQSSYQPSRWGLNARVAHVRRVQKLWFDCRRVTSEGCSVYLGITSKLRAALSNERTRNTFSQNTKRKKRIPPTKAKEIAYSTVLFSVYFQICSQRYRSTWTPLNTLLLRKTQLCIEVFSSLGWEKKRFNDLSFLYSIFAIHNIAVFTKCLHSTDFGTRNHHNQCGYVEKYSDDSEKWNTILR